jgi:hypothetical protein
VAFLLQVVAFLPFPYQARHPVNLQDHLGDHPEAFLAFRQEVRLGAFAQIIQYNLEKFSYIYLWSNL